MAIINDHTLPPRPSSPPIPPPPRSSDLKRKREVDDPPRRINIPPFKSNGNNGDWREAGYAGPPGIEVEFGPHRFFKRGTRQAPEWEKYRQVAIWVDTFNWDQKAARARFIDQHVPEGYSLTAFLAVWKIPFARICWGFRRCVKVRESDLEVRPNERHHPGLTMDEFRTAPGRPSFSRVSTAPQENNVRDIGFDVRGPKRIAHEEMNQRAGK